MGPGYRQGNSRMTTPACGLRDLVIAFANRDVVGESPGREGQRMKESVLGFGQIFTNKIVRCMTIIADRYCAMPGFFPGVVILLHHMTVGAGLRIVGEVGVAFGVDEGIKTESSREPDQNAQHDDRKRLQSILPPLEQDVQ